MRLLSAVDFALRRSRNYTLPHILRVIASSIRDAQHRRRSGTKAFVSRASSAPWRTYRRPAGGSQVHGL